jgi:transposase
LVETAAKNFTLREVSADKAYSSRRCLESISATGATPFIPFKSSARPTGTDLYRKLYHFFSLNRDEFMAHYHKRSNVESTMSMIKAKFRDELRSKTDTAMRNEALAKVLCHNICCVIGAIYELGIDPKFAALAA